MGAMETLTLLRVLLPAAFTSVSSAFLDFFRDFAVLRCNTDGHLLRFLWAENFEPSLHKFLGHCRATLTTFQMFPFSSVRKILPAETMVTVRRAMGNWGLNNRKPTRNPGVRHPISKTRGHHSATETRTLRTFPIPVSSHNL